MKISYKNKSEQPSTWKRIEFHLAHFIEQSRRQQQDELKAPQMLCIEAEADTKEHDKYGRILDATKSNLD